MIGESFKRTLVIFLYSIWAMAMIWLSSEVLWPLLAKVSSDLWSWKITAVIIFPIFIGVSWGLTVGVLESVSDRWYFMPILFLTVNVLAKGHLAGFQAIGGLIIYFLAGFGTYAYVYYGKRIFKHFCAINFFWLLPSVLDSVVRSSLASAEVENFSLFLSAFIFSAIFSIFSYCGFKRIAFCEAKNVLSVLLRKLSLKSESRKGQGDFYRFLNVQNFDFSCFVGEVVINQDCDSGELTVSLENSSEIREGFSVKQKNEKVIFKAGIVAGNCRALINLPSDIDEVCIRTFGRVVISSSIYGVRRMSIQAESLEVGEILSVEDLLISLYSGDKEVVSKIGAIKTVNAHFDIAGSGHSFEAESVVVEKENKVVAGKGVKVAVRYFGAANLISCVGASGSNISLTENGLFIS